MLLMCMRHCRIVLLDVYIFINFNQIMKVTLNASSFQFYAKSSMCSLNWLTCVHVVELECIV